jgi:hypothetical protein
VFVERGGERVGDCDWESDALWSLVVDVFWQKDCGDTYDNSLRGNIDPSHNVTQSQLVQRHTNCQEVASPPTSLQQA